MFLRIEKGDLGEEGLEPSSFRAFRVGFRSSFAMEFRTNKSVNVIRRSFIISFASQTRS